MKRREFLSTTAALAAGTIFRQQHLLAEQSPPAGTIRIDRPYHGAVLHRRLKEPVIAALDGPDGKPVALKIRVEGEAAPGTVTVNGLVAQQEGRRFQAEVELRQKETEIVVTLQKENAATEEARVKVWWIKNSVPRYRFTFDDTIYCLREIRRENPKSLFDDYFLGGLRKLHRKYGTKFALNLFYETSDDYREYFNLSQFPDKYKSEWKDNADWLRLLFHAKREHPGEPYKEASAETLVTDFLQVGEEIRRFAGEESYLPATVIHFGQIRPETWKPLANQGVTTLSGYFVKNGAGQYYVHYQMDEARCDYLNKHDFLVDFDSGIVFSKMDFVSNLVPLDQTRRRLQEALADPNTAEFVDLMTHEQYFWPFYGNYLPDHWDRLETAFAFLTEKGYKPVFLNDPLLGVDDFA